MISENRVHYLAIIYLEKKYDKMLEVTYALTRDYDMWTDKI